MSVTVYRDLDRGMPQLVFDVDRALAILEKQGGKRVAEVMESHPSQLGLR